MSVAKKDLGLTGVLYRLLKDAVNIMQAHLKKNRKNSSANLYSSFKSSVNVNGFDYDCNITTTADYWDFVVEGVQGHGNGATKPNKPMKAKNSPYKFKIGPPAKVFRAWVRQKPVNVAKGVEYAMAKSAGRYGIEGSDYITPAVNYLSSDYTQKQIASVIENKLGSDLSQLGEIESIEVI